MKVSISTDGEHVSAHFGRCPSFTLAVISDGREQERSVVPNPGHHPGSLPLFLKQRGVDCVVAGGMGQRAQMLFNEVGIRTVVGITGTVDDVVRKLAEGTLQGAESLCRPGAGKGYGLDKTACDHDGDAQDSREPGAQE